MATSWAEEGALVDMKNRLDKLRIDQSRQKIEDEEQEKKDTLKILQSKFGSMVYDPTNPKQKAYDRRCARTGRRKSIEFEDLYLTKGSGRLHGNFPLPSPGATGAATPRKHPLVRSNTGLDNHLRHHSNPSSPSPSRGGSADHRHSRYRKTSDPSAATASSAVFRKIDPYHNPTGSGGKGQGGGHPKGQGQGHGVKGGLMSVPVSEEERKLIDQKLSGLTDTGTGSGLQPPSSPPLQQQQRRRKISSPSKLALKR